MRQPFFMVAIVAACLLAVTFFYLVFWQKKVDLAFWMGASMVAGLVFGYLFFYKPYPSDMVGALEYVKSHALEKSIDLENFEFDTIGNTYYVSFPNEKPPITLKFEVDGEGRFVSKGKLNERLWEVMYKINNMKIKELNAKKDLLDSIDFTRNLDGRSEGYNDEGIQKV